MILAIVLATWAVSVVSAFAYGLTCGEALARDRRQVTFTSAAATEGSGAAEAGGGGTDPAE